MGLSPSLIGLVAVLCVLAVVYVPLMRFGQGGWTADYFCPGESNLMQKEIHRLNNELEELKKTNGNLQHALSRSVATSARLGASQGGSAITLQSSHVDPTIIKLDLGEMLGPHAFTAGVSYDPFVCFPTLKQAFPKASESEIKAVSDRARKDLIHSFAEVHNISASDVDTTAEYYQHKFHSPGKFSANLTGSLHAIFNDSTFLLWRKTISLILSRYFMTPYGNLYVGYMNFCPEAHIAGSKTINLLGELCKTQVSLEKAPEYIGFYNKPWDAIDSIIRDALNVGTCTTHFRNGSASWAHWLTTLRTTPEWKTFDVPNGLMDLVVLLFDMLYEHQTVFSRQYWMGVITMQNPFDVYAIQDIIYSTRPDLLIETGTANGGSALLWAGIMELAELPDTSQILTVDLNEPVWTAGSRSWGGVPREDPTKSKLWQKRIRFHKNSTDNPAFFELVVKASALGKKSVMVALDSAHHGLHVAKELELYCPLVTVGSYCIIEDTKMSRWHSDGPLAAVKDFVGRHPEFVIDRSRELLYSHHTFGYLKRVK
jgi:cephalosporin hydroxylase